MAKFLFVVQGEGRGHMTQAITLQNMLQAEGHTISEVILGKSRNGQTPDFVKNLIQCPISVFESPCFIMDAKNKSIRLGPSVINNILKAKTFRKSLAFLRSKIKEHQPDLIINFYEPLIGLCYLFKDPKVPMVCIAHQYIYHHPDFEFPVSGQNGDKMGIKAYTSLTSFGAKKKFALSFYPINDYEKLGIVGMPPLLRKDVFEIKAGNGNFLLVYLAVSGYMEDIVEWHKNNSGVELHCFTDKITEETTKHSENLYFHKLNDKKFLELMASSKGLVSTAGFESVCEAMYLGKPVFMVPVQGHFEQFCNARDAAKAGAGIYSDTFNLEKFIAYLSEPKKYQQQQFKTWVDSGNNLFLKHINDLLQSKQPVSKLNATHI